MHDFIVVGSGFAGAIIAERVSSQLGARVLVLEQREHIAGNMFDYSDSHGVLIHRYGPHIFRTASQRVLEYLSQFTAWHHYEHRVLAQVNGQLVPVPFNLTSLERLLPEQAQRLKAVLVDQFGMESKVPVSALRAHTDPDVRVLGQFIFENIYLNYTTKQWGDKPENLDFETITQRVPVHVSYDDRYFQEKHQALPADGYTAMFGRMLSNPLIEVRLRTRASDVLTLDRAAGCVAFEKRPFHGELVYTGAIDELFEYCFGELPYRSLRFELETFASGYFQPTGTVNYPNRHAYTRISEYKHMMAVKPAATTIMREYPQEYDRRTPGKDIPYYPVPKQQNDDAYARYRDLCSGFPGIRLIGRLAEYKYYDMNNIINRALDLFEQEIAVKYRR